MFRLAVVAVLLSLLGAVAARAEVLTCAMFKDRLATAFSEQSKGAAAPQFLDFGGTRSVRRYEWSSAPDLAGKLTCGPNDAFADFFMAYVPGARASSDVPGDLGHFDALAAASVCALSAGSPEACKAMVTTMTGDGVDQYKEDVAQHDERPQSLQDYDFAPNLDAVFYLTPTALSWAVGPGVFKAVDAARPLLAPVDRDTDD